MEDANEVLTPTENKDNSIQATQEKIANGLELFEKKKAELEELIKASKELKVTSLEDKEGIKKVEQYRKLIKTTRVEIQKTGKSMRDLITPISKEIKRREDELVNIISPEEERLEGIEKFIIAEKAKIQRQLEEAEQLRLSTRINLLLSAGFAFNGDKYTSGVYTLDSIQLKHYNDDEFNNVYNAGKAEYDKEQQRIEEENRKADLIRSRKKALSEYLPDEEIEAFENFEDWDEEDFTTTLSSAKENFEKAKIAKEEEQRRLSKQKEEQDKKEQELEQERKRIQDQQLALHNEKVKNRQVQLEFLGLVFNGSEYRYKSIVVTGNEVSNLSPEEWSISANQVKNSIEEVKKKEQEDKREEEERKQREDSRILKLMELGLTESPTLFIYKGQQKITVEKTFLTEANEIDWTTCIESLNSLISEYEKAEVERIEALKPDKEKLLQFADAIASIILPELSTPEAQDILIEIRADLQTTASKLKSLIQKV